MVLDGVAYAWVEKISKDRRGVNEESTREREMNEPHNCQKGATCEIFSGRDEEYRVDILLC